MRISPTALAFVSLGLPAMLATPARADGSVTLGPRPFYLVEAMAKSELQAELRACAEGPFERTLFSIGHRGAALQFPEHTKESYEAAARMGACDATFKGPAAGLPARAVRSAHHDRHPRHPTPPASHPQIRPPARRRRPSAARAT